jgi:adenine-specific DNA-methyltransferase
VATKGVDMSDPTTGKACTSSADGIACRFIDTDCDEESVLVRHAYFMGAKDSYERLKRTVKADIDEAQRHEPAVPVPTSRRAAAKMINDGDEVPELDRGPISTGLAKLTETVIFSGT